LIAEQVHAALSIAGVPRLIRAWQRAAGKRPFTIVMYHSIAEPYDDFTVGPSAFRQQLRVICSLSQVVRLREARTRLLQGGSQRQLVLTFDDAYENFYENAYPILQESSLPCTVFVPTGYIGKSSDWNEGPGIASRRVMDRGHLRELAASPLIDFGSHSVDHLNMRCLSTEQMRHQALDSKHGLEDLLGRQVISFAYPYGTMDHFSRATRAALRAADYEIAVTARWGTMNHASDLLALKRVSLKHCDGSSEVIAKLRGDYDWFAMKECLGFLSRRLAELGAARPSEAPH